MNELDILKEENLRLKLALSSFVTQFYDWQISPEEAEKYNIKYDEGNEKVECYFHTFESAGERAWQMLGFDKPIIGDDEMWELEKSLRDELLNLKYNKTT